eukprot:s2166_g6.t2
MQKSVYGKDSGLDQVTWSGEYSSWQDYVRRVRLAYERTEKKKRTLLGPELASRLKGKAWEVSVEINHEELRRPTGPRYLLRFLEERLLKTPINDLGLRLEDMFVKLRRQQGVGMSQWASQVRECYRMLKRSLGKLKASKAPLTEVNVRKHELEKSASRSKPSRSEPKRSVEEPEPHHESGSGPRSTTTEKPKDAADQEKEPASPSGGGDGERGAAASRHAMDEWDSWSQPFRDARWSEKDWKRWKEGRWKWSTREDSSDSEESEIQWEEFLYDEEVVPEEVLGWLLLRKAGLSASARLAVQSAIQGDLTFDKVERTLRDQEEELLSVERHGRSPHRPQATTGRRTFWVEQEGVWGILPEGVVDEFSDDQVLWATGEMQTSAGEETEDASCWTVTSSGNTLEWVYWDDEWCTQDHEGAWWSQADVQPWLDIEEIMALDNAAGQELMEIYGQFEAKRRSFQESRQIVKNKLLNRGFYPPKGKGIGKSPKGSFKGKPSGNVFGVNPGTPGKGKGAKGPQRPGSASFTGCFICGDKGHDYRSCPKRSASSSPTRSGPRAVAFADGEHQTEGAYMVMDFPVYLGDYPNGTTNLPAADQMPENEEVRVRHQDQFFVHESSEIFVQELSRTPLDALVATNQDQDKEMSVTSCESEYVLVVDIAVCEGCPEGELEGPAEARLSVFASLPYDFKGKAVLDIGATATVGSLSAIDDIMGALNSKGESETMKVYPGYQRPFKFGNGQVSSSLSYVEVPQRLDGRLVYLGIHTLDAEGVPVLLSVKTLKKLGAVIDVSRRLVIFQAINSRIAVRLDESPAGHLLLDLTRDWLHEAALTPPGSNKVTKTKGQPRKDRAPPEERLDYSRTVGIDVRDPRAQGGICKGNHTPDPMGRGSKSGRNGHAEWWTCKVCGIRLSYTPTWGATGIYRSAGPLPADTTLALENLQNKPGTKAAAEELQTREIAISGAEASLHRRLAELQRMKGARPKKSAAKPKDIEEATKGKEASDSETDSGYQKVPPVTGTPQVITATSDWKMTPHASRKKPHVKSAEEQEEDNKE